jgi:hypothetical protein
VWFKKSERVDCRICKSTLKAPGAQKCLDCESWQNWKRILPGGQLTLALLISLISVLSATVPPALAHFANRSRTYVRILGESTFQQDENAHPETAILLLVSNNGKRPSIVKSASIAFDGIDAAPVALTILDGDKKLVLPEKQVQLHVTAEHPISRTNGISRDDLLNSLGKGQAIITVDVEETGVDGNFFDASPPPEHRIAATMISEWMDRNVSLAP